MPTLPATQGTSAVRRLGRESQLALVANGEDAHLIAPDDESVQGHIAGATVGDHELADIAVHAPSKERMCGEGIDCGPNCRDCIQGGLWIVVAEELEGAFEVRQRSRRIDYRRHGLGRFAAGSRANRASLACTSSAR